MIQKNKLISLLKELNSKEWRDFEDFVASPIFNKSPQIMQLLTVLKSFSPNFNDVLFSKEYIAEKIYGTQEDSKDGNVSNLLSIKKMIIRFN